MDDSCHIISISCHGYWRDHAFFTGNFPDTLKSHWYRWTHGSYFSAQWNTDRHVRLLYIRCVILTCTSSSLLLKWENSTFSPSATRVREMPRRPVALVYASRGRTRNIMSRMIFTRLKEGCIGPRNRFLASFATLIMLAPASPEKSEGVQSWVNIRCVHGAHSTLFICIQCVSGKH